MRLNKPLLKEAKSTTGPWWHVLSSYARVFMKNVPPSINHFGAKLAYRLDARGVCLKAY